VLPKSWAAAGRWAGPKGTDGGEGGAGGRVARAADRKMKWGKWRAVASVVRFSPLVKHKPYQKGGGEKFKERAVR
jgi:hypothetical protein